MSPMNILMMSSSRPLQSWPRLDIIDDHTKHSLMLCFVTDHWLEWSQYSNLLSLVPTSGNGMDWWLCMSPLGQMGQPRLHHHGIWTGSDQIHSGAGSSKYYMEKGATFYCGFPQSSVKQTSNEIGGIALYCRETVYESISCVSIFQNQSFRNSSSNLN